MAGIVRYLKVLVLSVTAIPVFAATHGPSQSVHHLIEVVLDLFPEVDSQRVIPAPKPGEPAVILTAKIRPEVAMHRVRQASERSRTFPGGAVAGPAVAEDGGIRLAIRAASGREIGSLIVIGSGREVRIEIRMEDAEGAAPPIESLPAVLLEPEPVMRAFPLQE